MRIKIIPQDDGTFWVSTTCGCCKQTFGFLECKESEAKLTADLLSVANPVCLDCFSGDYNAN
jgi:hypothetical protein